MRSAVLCAASLAFSTALRAAPVSAPARPGAWAAAMVPVMRALPASSLGGLQGLDYAQTAHQRALAPMTAALRLEGMTPETFAALPSLEREMALLTAHAMARAEADERGRELLARSAKPSPPGGFLALSEDVDRFLVGEDHYYLDLDLFRTLMDARPNIREAADRELDAAGRALTVKVREGLALERRFDPALALADDAPLESVKAAYGTDLRDAARRRDAGAFWQLSDAAFADLHRRFAADGLDVIRRHPLGPWARAKLSAYDRQARALHEEVASLKRDHDLESFEYGVDDGHPLSTRRTYVKVPDTAARDWLLGRLDGIRAARERKDKRRLRAAEKALQKLAPFLPDGQLFDAVGPLSKLFSYFETRIAEAEKNPDPGHLPEVLAELKGEPQEAFLPAPGGPYRTAALVVAEAPSSEGPRIGDAATAWRAVERWWYPAYRRSLGTLLALTAFVTAIMAVVITWAAVASGSLMITAAFLVPTLALVRKYLPIGNNLRLFHYLRRRAPALLSRAPDRRLLGP